MADQEKLIDVVIKYSQVGGADVAKTQGDIRAQFTDKELQGNFDKFTQTVKAGNKEMVDSTAQLEAQFHSLRMAGRELMQIGSFFTITGGLLTAGIIADANNYVKTVGNINEENGKWIGYENAIKNANLEIGHSAEQAILPAMGQAAKLMQQVADVAKANPWLVSAVLTAGGVMLAIGATITVIASLVRVVADIGLLLTKAGVLGGVKALTPGTLGGGTGTAGGVSLGTVMLTATTVIIGAEIGLAIANAIEGAINSGEQKKYGSFNMGDVIGAPAQIELGLGRLEDSLIAKAIPSLDTWARNMAQSNAGFAEFIAHLTGANFTLNKLTDQWGKSPDTTLNTGPSQDIKDQETQSWIDFQKQIKAATDTYESARADTIKQYEQQILDVTQQYESQRAQTIADFEKQMAREARDFSEQQATSLRNFNQSQDLALRNYNEQVAKSNRDFQIQQRQAAQQHALEMAQIEAQHNMKMSDLAASRDALGLVKEQTSYETQKSEAEASYRLSQAQARQAHAQQLADQAAAFAQQRADALAAFQQQQADAQAAHDQQVADQTADEAARLAQMDQQHKLEMAKLDQQEKDKLTKMDDAYKAQVDMITTTFVDRLRVLDSAIYGDTVAYQQWMQRATQQFQTWLDNYKSTHTTVGSTLTGVGSGTGGKQAGGYAVFGGPGEDGRPEYVLNNQTTRMLEAINGGRLSQASMISMALAGRGGSAGAGAGSLQVTVTGKSLTIREIRAEVAAAMDQRLSDLIPAFGGG